MKKITKKINLTVTEVQQGARIEKDGGVDVVVSAAVVVYEERDTHHPHHQQHENLGLHGLRTGDL